jgi:uncharacterized DUF497 family protein
MYVQYKLTFEWDEAKSQRTKAERNIDFSYAATVFIDAERIEGAARSKKEARFYAIGKAAFGEILFVVFTWRHYENENEKICRIISVRKANKKERSRYPRVC